jgi:hypothetical protein
MQRNAGRTLALAITLVTMGATASAASAGTLGPPPWNGALCPAVGFDTGCEYGIDVTAVDGTGAASFVTISRDANQPPYDGIEDAIIVVQNDTLSPLSSLTLGRTGSGNDMFAFDGDGLCNPDGGGNASRGVPSNPPAGCPFGGLTSTGYEGPNNTFTNVILPDKAQGTVTFTMPLMPGQSTYFSLEVAPNLPPTFGVNDWITTTQAAPGQTPASNVAVASGTNVTDTAVVNGQHGAVATGSVVYTLFDNSACSGPPVYTSPIEPVTSGVAAPSDPVGAALPNGRYYWLVNYSGDTNNSSAVSLCGDETLDIGPTTVTTNLSATVVTPGTAVTDTAVITGVGPVGAATGQATFKIFIDPTCTTQLGAAEVHTVTAGTVTSSPRVLPTGGPYYYVVSYSGDSANSPGVSTCGSEALLVQAPSKTTGTPPTTGTTPPTTGKPPTTKTPNTPRTPNDTITLLGKPKINRSTGVIRQKVFVFDPGVPGWRLTFKRCKGGKVKPGHKCATRTVVYGHGHVTIVAGMFTIKVTPSAAIRKALRQGKTLALAASFTFQSSLGGLPGHANARIVVHGKKPKHRKQH